MKMHITNTLCLCDYCLKNLIFVISLLHTPWIVWQQGHRVREKLRSPKEMKSVTGPWVFVGIYPLQRMILLHISHNNKLYFKVCNELELISSLCPCCSLLLTDPIPSWCWFSLLSGRSLILSYSMWLSFSLTEILEQTVAVPTDLWEICHVSCFKQVV